jgi:Alginate lyase
MYNVELPFGKKFSFLCAMNSNPRTRAMIAALCALFCLSPSAIPSHGQSASRASAESAPRVFLLDGNRLQLVRTAIKRGDKEIENAWSKLQRDAQKALAGASISIVNKSVAPPSGDKHDYMSQAPYFWPNPKTPNGLPYVRRDGERNPEINKITDHKSIDDLENAAETLALAYYFTGDEKYASKAVELLRAFFLDPATRMNANLEYAQFIPGVNTGRGIGLIETRGLTRVVDAIGLLAGSKALTSEDERGLKKWFGKFLQWMRDSKNGREESAAKNNHGTYYDVQVVSFALFVGRMDLAKQTLEQAKQKRIATQIEPDGRQPLELARTKAWSYSNGNLDGLMQLATLAQHVGVDLWNFQTKDGRGIRKALDFLVPIAIGEKRWAYQEIEGGVKPETLFPLMRRAAAIYRDSAYQAVMARVPAADPSDRGILFRANVTSAN